MHSGRDEAFVRHTALVMQFGQLLDHDATLTPEISFCSQSCPREPEMDCCETEANGGHERVKACLPIHVDDKDPVQPGIGCMDFKRSQRFTCPFYGLAENSNEQFNAITSFIDASMVYGSTAEKARTLRSLSGGRLKIGEERDDDNADEELLPFVPESCPHAVEDETEREFLAGDERVNENPGLQTLHTLFVREHNRLAAEIAAQFPTKTDEEIYQEARRFVVAEWQRIVYDEYLPIVLGPAASFDDDGVDVNGASTYKAGYSPGIFNEFATAAFRFGHSMIPNDIALFTEHSQKTVPLANHFFNTSLVQAGEMNSVLRGMVNHRAEMTNNIVADAVTNFLFKRRGKTFGGDLPARNIQRGRDHEIAPYGFYR